MRRLLWALALAVPLAACGDDGGELGDVDAAIVAPRPHDDDSCFTVVGANHPDDGGWNVVTAPRGWSGDDDAYDFTLIDGDEAEACAFACGWEAEHCDGGAREPCGNAPDREPTRCTDG